MAVSDSKVLLIEDSTFLRIATERGLSKAGFIVSSAADGEAGLQLANTALPDIILLDLLVSVCCRQHTLMWRRDLCGARLGCA